MSLFLAAEQCDYRRPVVHWHTAGELSTLQFRFSSFKQKEEGEEIEKERLKDVEFLRTEFFSRSTVLLLFQQRSAKVIVGRTTSIAFIHTQTHTHTQNKICPFNLSAHSCWAVITSRNQPGSKDIVDNSRHHSESRWDLNLNLKAIGRWVLTNCIFSHFV